jgi:hypothetical protein
MARLQLSAVLLCLVAAQLWNVALGQASGQGSVSSGGPDFSTLDSQVQNSIVPGVADLLAKDTVTQSTIPDVDMPEIYLNTAGAAVPQLLQIMLGFAAVWVGGMLI